DEIAVAVRAGEGERGYTIPVRRPGVGAGANQEVGGVDVVLIGCPVQRGHPVNLGRVHVRVLPQQHANRRAVHFFGGVGDHRVGTDGEYPGGGHPPHGPADDDGVHAHNHFLPILPILPIPPDHSDSNSSIFPWLSAKASIRTPTFSSSVRCSAASGTGSTYLM